MNIRDISNLNNSKKCIVWLYVLIHTYKRQVYKAKRWDIWSNQTWISMLNTSQIARSISNLNKYRNYFWVMWYLGAGCTFRNLCDLLSSPIAESLLSSSSDPVWCPLFCLLLGLWHSLGHGCTWQGKSKFVQTLIMANSHKLIYVPHMFFIL